MAKPSYSEREIMALLNSPDTVRRGFEMLVAQYSEQLYWQIRRMVLSHEDANDCYRIHSSRLGRTSIALEQSRR